MKHSVIFGLAFVLALALTACGGSSEGAVSAGAGTGTDSSAASAAESAAAQGALSPVAQNILGILKLEDTESAVDTAQAATLLPLWQAYRSLLNSDTTAPAELEALQTQIDQTLTDGQRQAIAAMDLGPEDISAVVEELGLTPIAGGGEGTDTTRPSFQGGAPDGGGGNAPPAGGFIFRQEGGQGGGPQLEGGFEADPQLMATMQASRPAGGQRDRFSLLLLDPLIELLKERAAS